VNALGLKAHDGHINNAEKNRMNFIQMILPKVKKVFEIAPFSSLNVVVFSAPPQTARSTPTIEKLCFWSSTDQQSSE
jgi:hypothetical protein